jgi:hypothetical protein
MAQKTKIQIRRDTAANWTSANPTPAQGEFCFETDTKKLKIGDGSTAWTSLEYTNYLSNLKDVTLTSLTTDQILKWNGTAWVNATQSAGHTQNTDTGTTETTFQIDSDDTGPKLKNNSGELQIRNAADDAYADIRVKNLTVEGTTTTIHSETLEIADNTVLLNSNVTGTPTEDGGIEIERGTSTNAILIWDETDDKWKCGVSGSEVAIMLTGDAPTAHDLTSHTESGLTAGHFLKATGVDSFAFGAHGLGASDVGAIAAPGSPAQGQVLYYNGAAWAALGPDTNGKMLMTQGAGANPAWSDIDGGSA